MSMNPTSMETQSTQPRWIRITEPENIPLREGRGVEVDGHQIALFNLGDRFLAVENRCPHRGGPLSDGIVAGAVVVCPLHAWRVCLDDGSVVKPAGENGLRNELPGPDGRWRCLGSDSSSETGSEPTPA